jgi:hypothetical protein
MLHEAMNLSVTGSVMRFAAKLALGTSVFLSSVPSAFALQWNCGVPEIDGPAGISAVAVLMSIGVMAYERFKA